MYDDTVTLEPTDKQLKFARRISCALREAIPPNAKTDRRALSRWIDRHQADYRVEAPTRSDTSATSKQVQFAERIARAKRRAVPDECFRSSALMSAWISSNK